MKAGSGKKFSIELLREVMTYNPDTGSFCSTEKHYFGAGRILGCVDSGGYVAIGVAHKVFRAHRLAMMWMNGAWPDRQVDHINGVRTDNRWANLREASASVNCENQRRATSKNKVGLLGVSRHRSGNRWLAYIHVKGKTKYVGIYRTPELAHEAYVVAKRVFHEGCTI